jgi:hypothetical protein
MPDHAGDRRAAHLDHGASRSPPYQPDPGGCAPQIRSLHPVLDDVRSLADSLVTGADQPKPLSCSACMHAPRTSTRTTAVLSQLICRSSSLGCLWVWWSVAPPCRHTGPEQGLCGAVQVTRSMDPRPKAARDGVLAQRLSSIPACRLSNGRSSRVQHCCSRGELLIKTPTCRFFRTSACPRSLSRESIADLRCVRLSGTVGAHIFRSIMSLAAGVQLPRPPTRPPTALQVDDRMILAPR